MPRKSRREGVTSCTMRFSADLFERLDQIAQVERRSRNALIEHVLEQYVERRRAIPVALEMDLAESA